MTRTILVRTSILTGIVFPMTVKPPLEASLMTAAAGAGLLAALPCFGQRTSQGSMVSV